jgi:hypothetical protein
MTPAAQQQAELGQRLARVEVKLAQVWQRLTALPPDQTGEDRLIELVEQFEALSDARVRLRRQCEAPA